MSLKVGKKTKILNSIMLLFLFLLIPLLFFIFINSNKAFANVGNHQGNDIEPNYSLDKLIHKGNGEYEFDMSSSVSEDKADYSWDTHNDLSSSSVGNNQFSLHFQNKSHGSGKKYTTRFAFNYRIPQEILNLRSAYPEAFDLSYKVKLNMWGSNGSLYNTFIGALKSDSYVVSSGIIGTHTTDFGTYKSQQGDKLQSSEKKGGYHSDLNGSFGDKIDGSTKYITMLFYHYTYGRSSKIPFNQTAKVSDFKLTLKKKSTIGLTKPHIQGGLAGINTSKLISGGADYEIFGSSYSSISNKFSKIENDIQSKLDKVTIEDSKTKVELMSLAANKINKDGFDCYKWASFMFADYTALNPELTAKFLNPTTDYTEVKKIKVGDTDVDINASEGTGVINLSGEEVGKYKYKKEGKKLRFTVYINKNCDFDISAFNTYDVQYDVKCKFNGIHEIKNITDVSDTDFAHKNIDEINGWLHGNANASFSTVQPDDSGHTLFYYALSRSADKSFGTPTTFTFDDLKGKMPIGYSSISNLVCDVTTGYVNEVAPVMTSGDVTQNGYYRLEVVAASVDGKISGVTTIYFKVDKTVPTTTIKKLLGDSESEIDKADNEKWFNQKIAVELLLNPNMSGNYIEYDTGEEPIKLFFSNNKITRINDRKNLDVTNLTENFIEYSIEAVGAQTKIKIVFGNLPNVDGKYENVNIKSKFKTYVGEDDEHSDPLAYTNTEWGEKVSIKIDRTAPGDITINDEEEIIVDEYINAKWYTDRWIKKLEFELDADELGSALGEDYKDIIFYIGITKSEFAEKNGSKLDDVYTTLQDAEVESYFNRVDRIKGSQIGSSFARDFDFDLGDNSYGNRTIYFWIKDQAGNFGVIYKRYLKVDPTKYQLRTEFYRAGIVENREYLPEIQLLNEEGDEVSIAMRGEKITIIPSLSDKFASYKFSTKFGKEDSLAIANLLEQKEEHRKANQFHATSLISADCPLSMASGGSFVYDLGFGDETKKFTDGANGTGNEKNTIRFKYEYKRIVNYTISSFVSEYSGNELKLDVDVEEENETELGTLQNLFATSTGIVSFVKDGSPIVGKVDVGTYKVKVNLSNATDAQIKNGYILDETEEDFTIIKRIARVKVKGNLQKIYKDALDLNDVTNRSYIIENLTSDDESEFNAGNMAGLTGTVKLDTTTAMEDLNVGLYRVVVDQDFEHKNYQFEFIEGNLNVKPYEINVRPKDATKVYGDNDGEILFEVDDIADITTIIKNIEAEDIGNRIYKGKDGVNVILRSAGENVDEYSYKATGINFDVDSNYKVKVDTSFGKFRITKRAITLTPKVGQEAKVREETDITETFINGQNPEFDLDEVVFTAELAGVLKVKWDATISGTSREYEYELNLGLHERNFDVTLVDTEKFKVEVIGNKVIVRSKDRVKFIYGNENIFTYLGNEDKFEFDGVDIVGKSVDLTWDEKKFNLENAGIYYVEVQNPQLLIDGVPHEIVCEKFVVEIEQREVEIKITLLKETKEYGEDDSVYGIGFESLPDKEGGVLVVNKGKLGRIIKGEGPSSNVFDDITDVNGKIYGTDKQYVVGVVEEFVLSNPNYKAVLKEEKNIYIQRKKLNIAENNFIGKNKTFDNTSKFEINFDTDKIYDLDLVKANEAFLHAREIYYSTVNVDEPSAEKGPKDIIFKQISLAGPKAYNYIILKDGNPISLDDVFKKGGFEIEDIATIKLKKGWFTINKQYDATNEVNGEDITILEKLLRNFKRMIVEASRFSGVNVGTQELLAKIKFTFKDVDENVVRLELADGETDINLEYEGNQWYITINNIGGKIVPREIAPSEMNLTIEGSEDLSNITRTYNATKSVEIKGELKNKTGIYQNLKFKFEGEVASKDVGRHSIEVTHIYSNDENFIAKKELFNEFLLRNKVVITKAKLLPEIIFRESGVEYNGTTNLDFTNDGVEFERDKTKIALITSKTIVDNIITMPTELKRELEKIEITVTGSFTLTKDGVLNKDVIFGSDNKETYHDFIISNLNVKHKEDKYLEVMKNYELFGFNSYTFDGSHYLKDKSLNEYDLSEGEKNINNVEYKNVLILKRKEIKLSESSLVAEDKIFHGYNQHGRIDANARYAQDDTFATGEESKLEIELKAAFKGRSVKRGIDNNPTKALVMVSVLGLKNKDSSDSIDYTKNYILNKQYLNTVKFEFEQGVPEDAVRIEAILKPAPVVVSEFNLETREYDGGVTARTIEPNSISGFLDNDTDKNDYKVTIKYATYNTKDVEVDSDDNITTKAGRVYSVKVERKKLGSSNYVLSYIDNSSSEIPYMEKDGNKYYILPVSKRFIPIANYSEADHRDKVVGRYFHDGQDGYLVKAGIAIPNTVARDIASVNYAEATGKITKAKLRVDYQIITGSAYYDGTKVALKKYFDGTKNFNGVYKTDFEFKKASLKGTDTWDDTDFVVSAEFKSFKVGRTDIIIKGSFNGNTNLLARNYIIDEEGTTINGWIYAPKITIKVNDIDLQYGHKISESILSNEYSIEVGSEEVALQYIDGKLFMPYEKYKTLFQEPEASIRYGIVGAEAVQDDAGNYVKIDGELFISINSTVASNNNIGDRPTFTLNVRSPENKLEPLVTYTNGTTSAVAAIVKANIYVSPINQYEYQYAFGWDNWDKKQIILHFSKLANDESNGFVNGDTAEKEFGDAFKDAVNKIKFVKYTSDTTYVDLDDKPKYVEHLADGEKYLMLLPDEFSALENEKYKVVIKDKKHWKGGTLVVTEAELKISQRKDLEFYFEGETALEQAKKILNLEKTPAKPGEEDEVTYKFTQITKQGNIELDLANGDILQVGDYFVEVSLLRKFANDANNYAYKKVDIKTRNDGQPGAPRIKIKKSKIDFGHENLNKQYKLDQNLDHDINKLKINRTFRGTIDVSDFDYKWTKRVGFEDIENPEVGIGSYKIAYTVKETKREFYERNFINSSFQYSYHISPQTVVINILSELEYSNDTKEYIWKGDFSSEVKPISIDVQTNDDAEKLSEIYVEYYKQIKDKNKRTSETIAKPGRYLFTFKSRDDKELKREHIDFKYQLKGKDIDRASSFAVEMYTNSVKENNGSTANTLGDAKILASELYVKEIVSGTDLEGTAISATINKIFKENSMKYRAKNIYKIKVIDGGKEINAEGKMKYKIKVGLGVDKTNLYKYAGGQLEELKNVVKKGEFIEFEAEDLEYLIIAKKSMTREQIITISVATVAVVLALAIIAGVVAFVIIDKKRYVARN